MVILLLIVKPETLAVVSPTSLQVKVPVRSMILPAGAVVKTEVNVFLGKPARPELVSFPFTLSA